MSDWACIADPGRSKSERAPAGLPTLTCSLLSLAHPEQMSREIHALSKSALLIVLRMPLVGSLLAAGPGRPLE